MIKNFVVEIYKDYFTKSRIRFINLFNYRFTYIGVLGVFLIGIFQVLNLLTKSAVLTSIFLDVFDKWLNTKSNISGRLLNIVEIFFRYLIYSYAFIKIIFKYLNFKIKAIIVKSFWKKTFLKNFVYKLKKMRFVFLKRLRFLYFLLFFFILCIWHFIVTFLKYLLMLNSILRLKKIFKKLWKIIKKIK